MGWKYGTFQSHVLSPVNVVSKLPANISFEEGSVLPLAVNTAALGLFAQSTLALTPRPSLSPKPSGKFVFIYGGSSSVGSTAIQLAKAAGAFVVTTASKRNHDFCRSLGADQVYDYSDPEWIGKVAAVLKGKSIAGAFDPIAKPETWKATKDVLAQAGSDSPISTTLPVPEGEKMAFVFGSSMTFDEDLAKSIWSDFLPGALEKGTFVPKPDPMVVGRGLESVQKGIETHRGGVSAQKVVITIAEA